jgi:hypothetical protein
MGSPEGWLLEVHGFLRNWNGSVEPLKWSVQFHASSVSPGEKVDSFHQIFKMCLPGYHVKHMGVREGERLHKLYPRGAGYGTLAGRLLNLHFYCAGESGDRAGSLWFCIWSENFITGMSVDADSTIHHHALQRPAGASGNLQSTSVPRP